VKQTTIDALCWIDPPSPSPSTPLAPASRPEAQDVDAIRSVYRLSFAPGLDRLLETSWFSTHGVATLTADRPLLTQFEHYLNAIATSSSASSARIANTETHLVWSLLAMVRRRRPSISEFVHGPSSSSGNPSPPSSSPSSSSPPAAALALALASSRAADAREAARRLDLLEALLTGGPVESAALVDPPESPDGGPTDLTSQLRARSRAFWHCVAHFLLLPERDTALARARALLDSREARDVVYSAMLMRALAETHHASASSSADGEGLRGAPREALVPGPGPTPAECDWRTASEFLAAQAGGQATTAVVRRVCGMVLRGMGTGG
jgi:white-opaque regulator 2